MTFRLQDARLRRYRFKAVAILGDTGTDGYNAETNGHARGSLGMTFRAHELWMAIAKRPIANPKITTACLCEPARNVRSFARCRGHELITQLRYSSLAFQGRRISSPNR